MAVTMQQVAELAGVSRGTVDRVLHGRPNVDAVVREKVLRAAEKLGYSCKKTASAPRHRAAILIPQWTDIVAVAINPPNKINAIPNM